MPFDRATLPRDPDRLIEIIMALQDRNVHLQGIVATSTLSREETLMFAVSSSRHRNPCLSFKLFSMAATGQSGRHDHETTVDHALIRGLVTAGPVIRRGASSV